MKSPKTMYLTEQCQLMSHRNSIHSVRTGTKMSKTSSPWYRNLTVYSSMHFKMKHVLTTFLSFYRLNAIPMHKCKSFVQNALLKGSYSYTNVDLDPLFIPVKVSSLLFDIVANYA